MSPNLKDLYGHCAISPCRCLVLQRWIGRDCPEWRPLGPETQEELLRYRRERYHAQQDRLRQAYRNVSDTDQSANVGES